MAELRRHVALARVIGFSLCFLAPAIYLLLLVQVPFRGNLRALVGDFHSVPWGDLRIIVLSAAGLALLAAGPFLAQQFWNRANLAGTSGEMFANLRMGHIIHCTLMESVAVFGLVMGFAVGPAAGPLCLLMLSVPPVGYLLLVPGARSRLRLLRLRAFNPPGGQPDRPSSILPGDDLGAS